MSHADPDPNDLHDMLHAYYYDSGRRSRSFSILLRYDNNDAIDLALIPDGGEETIRVWGQGIEAVMDELSHKLFRVMRDALLKDDESDPQDPAV